MTFHVRTVLSVLLRAVALPLVAWAAFAVVDAASGPVVGANIGAGLAGLGAVALASGAWAVVDGLRASGAAPVLLRWLAVGVLTVPLLVATGQLGVPGGIDAAVWRADLLAVGWFWLGLVLGPAAVGTFVGRAAGPRAASGHLAA